MQLSGAADAGEAAADHNKPKYKTLSAEELAKIEEKKRRKKAAELGIKLVAASLTGLIMLLKSYNKDIRKVCLVAEGSLFWSENRKDKNYNILVMEKLRELLQLFGLKDIEVDIKSMNNANLIGTGIAALS